MSKTNKQQGNVFEAYVESLYQSLGYKTKRNEIIYGQEIDIIVEKYLDGIGEIKTLVECKYLSKGKVSNQIVFEFLSYLKSLPDHLGITKGVIVTNTSFSPQSKLGDHKILSLVPVEEIEKEILELSNPFVILKKKYESENIFSVYVPLSGNLLKEDIKPRDPSSLPNRNDSEEDQHPKWGKSLFDDVDDIEQEVLQELLVPKWNNWGFISILGDYGSGKTTLLQRLFYQLIVNFLNKKSKLKPLYIELKNFHKYQDLESFITFSFKKIFGKEISFELLNKEIQSGNLVFLLDGFDEMTPQISQDIRLKNFNILFPILSSPSVSIITCRPSYFISNEEYHTYLTSLEDSYKSRLNFTTRQKPSNLKKIKLIEDTYSNLFAKYFGKGAIKQELKKNLTIFVNEFSDEQITLYLQKFNSQFRAKCNASSEEIKLFLSGIYDLSELMSKPLLLSMIKDTILLKGEKFKENNSIEFGPSSLYEIYTSINLDFDWQKGETRHFLTKEQRGQFAEAIALVMFDKNILEVSYIELCNMVESNSEILDALKGRLPKVSFENIVADIQICTFITRTQDDTFKFIHKSFMEFYVAKIIKNFVLKNMPDQRFNKINFPKEILYFIGSFATLEDKLKIKLSQLRTVSNKTCKRNATIAYLYSGNHTAISIRNITLNEISLSKIEFINCVFKNISFEKNTWRGLTFQSTEFIDIELKNVELSNTSFLNCKGNIILNGQLIKNCTFKSSKALSIMLHNIKMEKVTFNNCYILFNRSYNLIESMIISSTINLENNLNTYESEFENCNFPPSYYSITSRKTSFSDCIFNGQEINYNFETKSNFKKCKGLIFTEIDFKNQHYTKMRFNSIGINIDNGFIVVNIIRYRNHKIWVKKLAYNRYLKYIIDEEKSNK